MKTLRKKILTLFIICSFSLAVTVSSSDNIIGTQKANFFYASQEEILEEYEKYSSDNAELNGEYGGVYVDEFGNAVVNVKRNPKSDKVSLGEGSKTYTTSDGSRQIIVKEVKYSMAELECINDKILEFFPFLENYLMRELGISVKRNCIEIKIKDCEDTDKFLNVLLDKLNLPDSYTDMFDIGIFTSEDEFYYLSDLSQ